MADKIQKIREKVEKKLEVMQYQIHRKDAYKELKCILDYIDSMQEEPVSEELGEYINELSKQFPEVSFAKLSRIAVRVAKWQKEQIEEALLSKVLPCFMHGGEADEVMAKLDEVLNQKR